MKLNKTAKDISLILLPVVIFIGVYFLLGLFPNYEFGKVDTEGVYNLERQLFGMTMEDGTRVIPSEYFRVHHWAVADVLSGLFYLCWVPLPFIYALVLYFQGRRDLARNITWAFLMVNVVGFIGYYIYPSAPPWYVMDHGFEVITDTKGSAAGFANCDAITGIPFFHNFYDKNANVFAAIPSLHSAYNPIAFYYSLKKQDNRIWQTILAIVSAGIWFSAVYSGHHYIIDVILGVLTSVAGIAIYELLRRAVTGKASLQRQQ